MFRDVKTPSGTGKVIPTEYGPFGPTKGVDQYGAPHKADASGMFHPDWGFNDSKKTDGGGGGGGGGGGSGGGGGDMDGVQALLLLVVGVAALVFALYAAFAGAGIALFIYGARVAMVRGSKEDVKYPPALFFLGGAVIITITGFIPLEFGLIPWIQSWQRYVIALMAVGLGGFAILGFIRFLFMPTILDAITSVILLSISYILLIFLFFDVFSVHLSYSLYLISIVFSFLLFCIFWLLILLKVYISEIILKFEMKIFIAMVLFIQTLIVIIMMAYNTDMHQKRGRINGMWISQHQCMGPNVVESMTISIDSLHSVSGVIELSTNVPSYKNTLEMYGTHYLDGSFNLRVGGTRQRARFEYHGTSHPENDIITLINPIQSCSVINLSKKINM